MLFPSLLPRFAPSLRRFEVCYGGGHTLYLRILNHASIDYDEMMAASYEIFTMQCIALLASTGNP